MKSTYQKIKEGWKSYSIYFVIALSFLLIGIGLANVDTLKQILTETISKTISNAPWLIIILIGFKIIAESIKKGINNLIDHFPNWLYQYEKIKLHASKREKALSFR